MREKVLFIDPPVTEEIWSNYYSEINLGLAYLARIAKEEGYQPEVLDCDSDYVTFRKLKRKVREIDPEYVAISSIYGSYENSKRIARAVKNNSDATVLMGGLVATFLPEKVLNQSKNVDIAFRGESERSFRKFLQGENLEDIEGISYRENGEVKHNKEVELIQDLDSLGMPLREVFPMQRYRLTFKLENSTIIETKRGCPYACDFCVQNRKEGSKLRYRSPEMVIRELKEIKDKFPTLKRIMIVDNDFLTNPEHARGILRKIIEEGLNNYFHFMIATRIDNLKRQGKETMDLLEESNVKRVYLGIESVSEKYKKDIGKIDSLKETINIVRELQSRDIVPYPSYILGYPEEDEEDINRTLELAKELNTGFVSFNILTPYPGTKFFEECKEKGILKNLSINKLDNAHQVIDHDLNLKKHFRRFHREYLFRLDYIKEGARDMIYWNRKDSEFYNRFLILLGYLVYYEFGTLRRIIKRKIKEKLFGEDCFL